MKYFVDLLSDKFLISTAVISLKYFALSGWEMIHCQMMKFMTAYADNSKTSFYGLQHVHLSNFYPFFFSEAASCDLSVCWIYIHNAQLWKSYGCLRYQNCLLVSIFGSHADLKSLAELCSRLNFSWLCINWVFSPQWSYLTIIDFNQWVVFMVIFIDDFAFG